MENDLDDLLATKLKDMRLEPQVSGPHEPVTFWESVTQGMQLAANGELKMKDEDLVLCFKVSYSPQTTFYLIEMPGSTNTFSIGPLEDTLQHIVSRLKVTEPSTKSKQNRNEHRL